MPVSLRLPPPSPPNAVKNKIECTRLRRVFTPFLRWSTAAVAARYPQGYSWYIHCSAWSSFTIDWRKVNFPLFDSSRPCGHHRIASSRAPCSREVLNFVLCNLVEVSWGRDCTCGSNVIEWRRQGHRKMCKKGRINCSHGVNEMRQAEPLAVNKWSKSLVCTRRN